MSDSVHIPVLLRETVAALAVQPKGLYLDGTFGRGGHTRAILERGGIVLGIDRDEAALAAGAELVRACAGSLTLVKGCHGDLRSLAEARGFAPLDGVLLDLGVSSPQLDEASRGFSFQQDGPLDMRMDRSQTLTAAELVRTADLARLERIFRENGEEPQARRIAQAIVRAREAGERFETTGALANLVLRAIGRHGAHHPATRVFQALRMEVNDEMGELTRALRDGLDLLRPGGRFAVITFESLTDRAVKRFFAAHVGVERSLQQGGAQWEGDLPKVRAVTRKAVTASVEELSLNPRARSAKLRVIERI